MVKAQSRRRGERGEGSPGADVTSPGGNVGTSIVGAPARNLVGFRALYGRASSVRLHVGEFCGRLAGTGERERASGTGHAGASTDGRRTCKGAGVRVRQLIHGEKAEDKNSDRRQGERVAPSHGGRSRNDADNM